MRVCAAILGIILTSPLFAADQFTVTTQSLANDQTVKARLGFGDPNVGTMGPYGSWTESDDGPMWGVGAFGQVNVSTPIAEGLSWLFKISDNSWAVLKALDGQMYVGAEIGADDLAGDPQAFGGPYLGARLGPVTVEVQQRGAIESWVHSQPVLFIGLQRVWRF